MLRVVVLGAAAGGGVPQWNCGCPVCRTARTDPEHQSTQASIAISADDAHWYLINASPDLRQQLIATPKLHPGGDDGAGDTLGLRVSDKATGKYFYFLAACADVTDELKSRLAGAPLVFFDGTVWRDDELITAGLGNKTGRDMGHIAMSGNSGAIESLAGLDIGTKIFLHINNSNPARLPASDERKMAERAGWQIPADGMEIVL